MNDQRGRHVVVTGGNRGIGRSVASSFSSAGARVTVIGRTRVELAEAVDAGIAAAYEVADVTNADAIRDAFTGASERAGPIDSLIANAGIADSMPFAELSDEGMQRLLDVNLFGLVRCARAVLPGMIDRGRGQIVALASMAGIKGYPRLSGYCASKHAAVGLVRALAAETARSGVTVNAICPGYTDTEMVETAIENVTASTGRTREEALRALVGSNPQRRLVTPDEVAAAALFLCSEEARSITGHALPIAGGET